MKHGRPTELQKPHRLKHNPCKETGLKFLRKRGYKPSKTNPLLVPMPQVRQLMRPVHAPKKRVGKA
jgi:hypothetical protein